MSVEFSPPIEQAQADLARALPEAPAYVERFSDELDNHPFAVIKVGGDMIKNPQRLEELSGSLDHLRRLGFTPVIVHGAGPQITDTYERFGKKRQKIDGLGVTDDESIGHVYSAVTATTEALIKMLPEGTSTRVGLVETTLKNYEKYGWVGTEAELGKEFKNEVLSSIEEGKIPIISCLGRVAVWDGVSDEELEVVVNMNGDDLARSVTKELEPQKYISITGSGGIWDAEGRIIPALHPEEVRDLIKTGVINEDMTKKAEEILRVFEEVENIDDVNLVLPANLIRELFTHTGEGTLVARLKRLTRIEKGGINEDEIRGLIEHAFSDQHTNAKLDPNYFELDDISHILVTPQKYGAVGVVREHEGVRYLCKIAARPEFRGRGLSTDIIEQAAEDGEPLFWRARTDEHDEVNILLRDYYEKHADSVSHAKSEDGNTWAVYAKNIENLSEEQVGEMLNWVTNQPPTITRTPAKAA